MNISARTKSVPPTVSLSAPVSTVTAAREVLLTARAIDASGIDRAEFYQNSKYVHQETQAPYDHHIDFASSRQNGVHQFEARAYDKVGNVKTSEAITITVNIPLPPDTVKPTVTLTAGPAQVSAPGTVNLKADAQDDRKVTMVKFYKGEMLIAIDEDAPFEVNATVTAADAGTVAFSAVAIDEAGNEGAGAAKTVTPTPIDGIDTNSFRGDWWYQVREVSDGDDYDGYVTWTGVAVMGDSSTVITGDAFSCSGGDKTACTADGDAILTYNRKSIVLKFNHMMSSCDLLPPHECTSVYAQWMEAEDTDAMFAEANGVTHIDGQAMVLKRKELDFGQFAMRSP
ncbi:Ig-like domain-containing protein [Deinococcus peraridilitoris]|uniref:Ig-like domain-containing protein n=1 Tax=Deinococcus peraridilitoris (strain DSM 19664 / LMG 22246 / CIP 109416 / KR-200) TaxID=937777 RepID=L0A861_DEIPD|nr:Ig-like domain-containing protein [Deinococcus peraridilitoris]AFZ69255.1 hypothetical protein Deipe_3833 [Deinococcus peraridilitoris DSM 19664]